MMRYLRYFRPHLQAFAVSASFALVFAVAMVAVGRADASTGVWIFVVVSATPLLFFGFVEAGMLFHSWREVRRP